MAHLQERVDELKELTSDDLLELLKLVLVENAGVLQDLVEWAVPDHAYGCARSLTESRFSGRIKSFSERHRYGFVTSPEIIDAFGMDLFVSDRQIRDFTVGEEVTFGILLNKGKPQAFDLAGSDRRFSNMNGEAHKSWQGGAGQGWDLTDGPKGERMGKASGGKPGGGYLWGENAEPRGKGGWAGKACGGEPPWFYKAGGGKGDYYEGKGGDFYDGKGGDYFDGRGEYYGGKGHKGGGGGCNGKGCWGGKSDWHGKGDVQGGSEADVHSQAGWDRADLPPPPAPPSSSQVRIPGVTGRRVVGEVKSSRPGKYGFLTSEELRGRDIEQDIFCHHSQMGDFKVGDWVSFQVIVNDNGGFKAVDLKPAENTGPPTKRARS
eukprot:TRINITY_DN44495_c0_g1_i1.p1 TRINITY_DN44495_c0_g1~~TRINITY_DN44495_c0_g1_i1.p1  ORF type:complete len:377 (-),score=54.85 TRINITY_DN44495_c0_g1_i1:109-1239(-)